MALWIALLVEYVRSITIRRAKTNIANKMRRRHQSSIITIKTWNREANLRIAFFRVLFKRFCCAMGGSRYGNKNAKERTKIQ